ncbi:MAG TPA: sterol desaturase family protein [Myxococcales bacterium]|nr:sterol desaturase family protein [Myxococcales bacterium]
MFSDYEPRDIGSGWVAGVASLLGGALGLFGVLCLHFPQFLTAPLLRAHYPVTLLRGVLQAVLIVAVVLGLLSAARRHRKVLGLSGIFLAIVAMALGGASVPLPESVETKFGLGLEWFALNLLVLALLFVPLERALPHEWEQHVFRPEWTTDGVHFLMSHLLVQAFSWAALLPSRMLRDALLPARELTLVGSLPLPVQFLAVLALADLTQYWIHRTFHRVRFLWRLHAVHHSSTAMDWLAGSRMHPLDALATRAGVMTILVLAGASTPAVALYLAFVSFHAVFIHANFGADLAWLEPFLATPRYHHFHHAAEAAAIDKNFAVHLPVLDRLFGTQFLPAETWPQTYGVSGTRIAPTYLAQIVDPFRG